MIYRLQALLTLYVIFFSSLTAHSEQLSVGAMGLSLHGFQEEPIYYKNMPRRIDDGARLVPSYELFLRYRMNSSHWIGSIGQDCYAQPAVYAAWGLYWPLSRYIDYGFVIGAYYRRTKPVSYNGETRNIKEFYTFDAGNGNQFVPMPLATLSMNFPIGQSTGVGMNIGSNIFVTHFVAVLSFDLSGPSTPGLHPSSAPGI